MKTNLCLLLFMLFGLHFMARAQAPAVYTISIYNTSPKDSVAFTSLSDNYIVSNHPDSLAVPKNSTAVYFKLAPKYRKRFLDALKISETDRLFAYDHETDAMASFAVKDLAVSAFLNVYMSADETPFAQTDYMIGFEINPALFKGFSPYLRGAMICIGKENPFQKGSVKPMAWKKIKPSDFPKMSMENESYSTLTAYVGLKYVSGNAYRCEVGGFTCYLRDIINENEVQARRLLVVSTKTGKKVTEKIFCSSEGVVLCPLNGERNDGYIYQYAGVLFKGLPPVVFGFEYFSFGCPPITFLKAAMPNLYLSCDNRH